MIAYFKSIVVGFWSVALGMSVTLKYFFSRKVTLQYPDQRMPMFDRFRGMVKCNPDICISCMYCVNICPVSCISLESVKADIPPKVMNLEGKEVKRLKDVTSFEIDVSRCIYCGFCAEGCPTGAIYMSHDYEISCRSREQMLYQWVKNPKNQ